MIHPFSNALDTVLKNFSSDRQTNINLEALNVHLALRFPKHRKRIRELINTHPAQLMRYGQLLFYLVKCIEHDCAVRDVMTTGHLAKVLSRLHLMKENDTYAVLGIPNPLFDRNSQRERTEYIRHNGSLLLSTTLIQSATAKKILRREKKVLKDLDIIN